MQAGFDPTGLSALVIDENPYSRAISIDQLRAMGFRSALGAADPRSAWDMLLHAPPSVILIEWFEGGGASVDFVRKIRTSEETPERAVPVLVLTAGGAQASVEAARAAGVNGYLRKPISALALGKYVSKAVAKPRPFIATSAYAGPCRRRKPASGFAGPWRRLDDVAPAAAAVPGDEDVLDLKGEIARARVAALAGVVRGLVAGDAASARAVYKSVQALVEAAEQIEDRCLVLGAKEMARYIQAQGATERLDPEVVNTHIAALQQLASLPHALTGERDKVAQSLKRMIDKKLRRAGAA